MVKKEDVISEQKEESKRLRTKKKVPKKPRDENKPKESKPVSKKKKSSNFSNSRGKRKKAIARASVRPGKGNVRINKMAVSGINNKYIRNLVLEPVKLAGEKALSVDISVNVSGGGVLGQAQSSRTAIARALVDYFADDSLKSLYLERDRSLLIEDSRRVESKKYKGPKARARYQKSYR